MLRMRSIAAVSLALVLLATAAAEAGTIWQWSHQAEGEGWAHVFDGGPVVTDSEFLQFASTPVMWFSAYDITRAGILGAGFSTAGQSWISPNGDNLGLDVRFSTGYDGNSRIGADLPGGEGGGSLSSVIEFVMPADVLQWDTSLSVRRSGAFSGSTRILIENVTQSQLLRDWSSPQVETTTLVGDSGDVIRISTDVTGSGSHPPGVPGYPEYRTRMTLIFTVPEPGAASLWLTALMGVARRRSRHRAR